MVLGNLRYIISEIKQNYDRGTWWRNRFASRVLSPIQSKIYDDPSAVKVSEESWDLLIILDACRADLFEEVVDTTDYDHYEVKKSRGSATREWTKENFNGQAKGRVKFGVNCGRLRRLQANFERSLMRHD